MNKRNISLRCGDRLVSVSVPEGVRYQIGALRRPDAKAEPAAVIREALDHPVGAPRIEAMLRPGQRVCIISDDNTRATPVADVLRELLPRIEGAGIRREDITIIFALGSHRRMTLREMAEKVGGDTAARYRLLNSEFEDDAQLVEVGKSELGTPIRVFRPAMEADVRIGIGSVVPHGCMGWSGGAKILYPGITSADIVSEFHVMQGLHEETLFGMTEAPTRLAVERWTRHIGLHYIVNTVLDADLAPYRAAAGDYVLAQRRAVSYARELCGIPLRERPDVILTAAYPIYMDFWQCGKAAYGPSGVIRGGGELLLLADCREGVGPHEKMLEYMALEDGTAELRRRLERHETGEDLLTLAVGASMGRIARSCRMTLVTDGLSPEECARGLMAHSPVRGLQRALESSLSRFDDPFLLILPEGGEAVPELADRAAT